MNEHIFLDFTTDAWGSKWLHNMNVEMILE